MAGGVESQGRAAGQQYVNEEEKAMKRTHYRRHDFGERFARCGRPSGRVTEHRERVTCLRCLEILLAVEVGRAYRGPEAMDAQIEGRA